VRNVVIVAFALAALLTPAVDTPAGVCCPPPPEVAWSPDGTRLAVAFPSPGSLLELSADASRVRSLVALRDGLSTPVGGFCSAHWFDYHQSGIIAQGYYQQGLRLIDVRNARDLRQYGYATGGASEVWDAYWVPQRDRKGRTTSKKTNVIYTTDLVRGLDVYEVDLPGTEPHETTLPALP